MKRPVKKATIRSPRKHLHTFADIRHKAEQRLRRGLKLDFDQIMLDIATLRARDQDLD